MRWAGAWNGVALSSWSVGGMRECGKDGKGTTEGSGAQHGSAADPWTA